MLLSDFMDRLPEKSRDPADQPAKKARVRDQHWEAAIQQCPWLAKLEVTKEGHFVKGGAAGSSAPLRDEAPVGDIVDEADIDEPGPAVEVIDEDTWLEHLADVDKARAVVAAAPGAVLDDFKTRVLQSEANVARFGQRHDAVQGYAANSLSVDFCVRRGVHKSKRLHLRHGPAACGVVARFWCARMQYFFNIELVALEGHRRVFTADDCDAFEEPREVAALLVVDSSAEVATVIREIRQLFVP